MLQSGYLSVLEAKTRDELQAELVRFTQQLGFQTVSAMAVVDHFLGESEFITIDNTPAGYRATFQEHNGGKRDPVMQHCKTKSVPIIWDQSTYVKAERGEMWENQARFGYRHGISLALHMPEGRHFLLGVDRDQPLPKDPAEVTRMVAALQLFAVHAQEASMRLLVPLAQMAGGLPALTPRELETLRWTMEGKTAWEVANVLGISERTAVLHANNAMHKLGCVNKHQAVLKALRLGLIR
ncbi:MAG TPA: autoinducer binding domain-containing protein, partial [Rhizobacter sp.]|nr:autoinducer binding domain-containing protein [Rhizobacter sp.]